MFIFYQLFSKPLDEVIFLWFIGVGQSKAVRKYLLYRRHRLCIWAFM